MRLISLENAVDPDRMEGILLQNDGQSLYLWDAVCGQAEKLLSLEEYGYSAVNGGEIAMGQGSQILIPPDTESKQVYLYEIASRNMLELDADTFWPWPTYESYKENFRDIKELEPDADERFSTQAFSSQGKIYYLYSEDGSLEQMELKEYTEN